MTHGLYKPTIKKIKAVIPRVLNKLAIKSIAKIINKFVYKSFKTELSLPLFAPVEVMLKDTKSEGE